MQEIYAIADYLIGFGDGGSSLTIVQTGARAALVYAFGYLLLRLGEHRFVGKNTAFDVVLGFIFGATLSRAINGSAPFVHTVLAGAVLLGIHWVVTLLAFRYDRFDTWLNGGAVPVVEDGEVRGDNMRNHHIGERLLMQNLRLQGGCDEVGHVKRAYYERNGAISVVQRSHADGRPAAADAQEEASGAQEQATPGEARVVEVEVREGVQTVRIELR